MLSDLHRFEDLKALFEESLRECESAVRQQPHTVWAWRWRIPLQSHLASIAESQGRFDGCEVYFRRALACAEEWLNVDPGGAALGSVTGRRRDLARHLAWSGRKAEARDLLVADRHALLDCAPAIVDETIVARRFVTYLEFRHLGLGAFPSLAAGESNAPDSGAGLTTAEADDLPATTWARLASGCLRAGAQRLSKKLTEAEVATNLTEPLTVIASEQRRWGQYDQARQTVDRLLALCRIVVEQDPNDPRAYLLLTESFYQAHKNAWQPTVDRPTIELNLRRAIGAAQHAVDLAPGDGFARERMERLRRKLHEFLHP